MKSKLFKKTVALVSTVSMIGTMGLVPVTVNASTVSLTYDFKDGKTVFTGRERVTLAIEDNADLNSKVVTFTNADKAQNKYSFSNYDFSDAVDGATEVTVEFDYYNLNGGRAILTLGDAKARGTTGGSSTRTYSNTGAVFNLGSDKSNAILNDSKLTLAEYTNKWLHVKVNVDETTNKYTYEVSEKSSGKQLSSAEDVSFLASDAFDCTQIDVFSYINDSKCAMIGNLSINAVISDVTRYNITYNVEGVETKESVAEGSSPVQIPTDLTKTGSIFKGWKVNDTDTILSSEELASYEVTAETTFTAVFEKDADYIEPIKSVEFSTAPTGNVLTAGPDENTPASNNFVVKAVGELGTDITSNPDSRVTDYKIDYELKGFNWKSHLKEATEDSTDWPYCDSYGKLVTDGNTADFQLKKHPFNYYGELVAKVTYNGQTLETTYPIAYIGDASANTNANQILPRGGYYEDVNAHSPDMVGYEAAISSNNVTATDAITDNWAAYGGNTKKLTIAEENGSRFFKIQALGTNSSCFAINRIEAVTDQQVVFSQNVRFHNANSTILLKTANPVTWNDNATTFGLSFANSALSLNDSKICDATTDVWYKIVITSDVTSGKCYAEVYDENGIKLGASEIVNFTNAGSTNPTYYGFRTPDRSVASLDFNNVKITRATIDDSTVKVTAPDAIAIPEKGQAAQTGTMTISANTTEGIPAIGKAEWSIDDSVVGVTVTPSEDDSHTATVSVEPGATSGDIPVTISLGGKTITKTLKVTASQDNIQFDNPVRSISIPLETGKSESYKYSAQVKDKDNNVLEGKTVTYALYDSKNVNPMIEVPSGMTFENGVLTVTSEAKAIKLCIRATSTNSAGEIISNFVAVDVHGLAFDFGAGTAEDIAEGYTSVTPTSAYSEKAGYGIDGTATAGGETSTDATADYLEGTYTFKANVQKAKYYTVDVTYQGTLKTAYINSDLAGYTLGTSNTMTIQSFTIPATRDYIDLLISSSGSTVGRIAAVTITQNEDKTAGAKPSIYQVGDSTAANNGSWAYHIDHNRASFSELDAIATFHSSGAGGTNLDSYYTKGRFASVLNNIRPGDILMLGNMGTNGMGNSFEEDMNYYLDAAEMFGAKIILNSYTPHGAVNGNTDYRWVYDSATHTFDSYRKDSYDVIVRKVAEERAASDKNYLGFVEIGKNADAAFNAYVADYASNGYENEDAAAQAIIACFGDHNHYSNGSIARDLMLNGYSGVEGIVSQIVTAIHNGDEPSIKTVYAADAVVVEATYNEDGILKSTSTVSVKEGDEVLEFPDVANTKVFVWNSLDEMQPVGTKTIEFPTNTEN